MISPALKEPQFYCVDLETPRPTVALYRKLFGKCLVEIFPNHEILGVFVCEVAKCFSVVFLTQI